MLAEVFGNKAPINELKTVEIDVEKKIFKINGEDVGKRNCGFNLSCFPRQNHAHNDGRWFEVTFSSDTTVYFSTHDITGKKIGEEMYEKPPKK